MVFNSLAFLLFFPVVFHLFWVTNNRSSVAFRNALLILFSYIFYGWWDWRFLSLIFISSAADFSLGLWIAKSKSSKRRSAFLGLSLLANLGILGFFKYCNFFVDSLAYSLSTLGWEVHLGTLEIILPVGISFYTFQTLSYTIDIYRNQFQPTKDVLSFFAFVAFFPQLVAGPIERASRLLLQFYSKKIFEYNKVVSGLRLVLWGMFMKVVLADNFGALADHLFLPLQNTSGVTTLVGAFFFSIQIYADFAGYSSIAIGLSRMLGFELMQNFATPYFATSLRRFWHRWHISLSTWFRDYVYIPLGGSKGSWQRTQINVFLTFVLSGLWHGAKITFVIWGALHGLLLILERVSNLKMGNSVFSIFIFCIVTLLWIPFRAENATHLWELAYSLVDFENYNGERLLAGIKQFSTLRFFVLVAVLLIFIKIEWSIQLQDFDRWINKKSKPIRIMIYYSLCLALILLGNFDVKPNFIYFQF